MSSLYSFWTSSDHLSVTGANRGIGLGIAECCLINGASKIYSIDLAEPGEEFQAISKRFPGRLFAVTANVTKEASVQAAVDQILAEAGGLHGMVVNAGRTNHKSALDFTTEEIEALFAVNVVICRSALVNSADNLPRSFLVHSTALVWRQRPLLRKESRAQSYLLHQWHRIDPTRCAVLDRKVTYLGLTISRRLFPRPHTVPPRQEYGT